MSDLFMTPEEFKAMFGETRPELRRALVSSNLGLRHFVWTLEWKRLVVTGTTIEEIDKKKEIKEQFIRSLYFSLAEEVTRIRP